MLLNEYEIQVYQWLKKLGIEEKFPYIENGIANEASSMEEIYYKAVLSYQTFSLIDRNRAYSPNDIRNVELLINYQRKMGAYYAPFLSKRSIDEKDIEGYSHEKLKHILTKAHRANRGIYYLSSLKGYTSTTLFLHPTYECLNGSNRKSKVRVWGRIQDVLPATLELYDGTVATFVFPYSIGEISSTTDSIYKIYELAFTNYADFSIAGSRGIYSGQQKRIIKKLITLGGGVLGESHRCL